MTVERTETVEVLEVGQRSLRELAELANSEHEAACQAAQSALVHWIGAGQALLEARPLVPHGEWGPWVDENFNASRELAGAYMRLATYRELVFQEGITTVNQARLFIRGLPPVHAGASDNMRARADEMRIEVQRLARNGIGYAEIGRLLGINSGQAWNMANPSVSRVRSKRRAAERRRAKEIAEQKKRDRAIRKIGGSVAECYSMIRKTSQALGRAHGEAKDREVRSALSAAMVKLHNAEDEIVRALGVS